MTPRPARNPRGRTGTRRPAAGRRGTILIVTMWIVLVLAALVLLLARSMRIEAFCSANQSSCLQAQAIEHGAIQYVLTCVDGLEGNVPSETDAPCEAVQIGEGAFWVLRPVHDDQDDRSWAFGIVDEGSKVNLNTAPATILAKLPGMTDELAASIIDWRDGDGTVTLGGAENEYYLMLADAYQCKNAPLETVEELFLIKGVTKELVFGEDINRNGVLDTNEDDGDASDPPDSRDGILDRGLAPLVTVYSVEPAPAASGTQQKINVNEGSGQALLDLLRQNMTEARAAEVAVQARRGRPFLNLLDFYARAGLEPEEFELIVDRLTTSTSNAAVRGRINVNTASGKVLACLPGLDDSDASALLARRTETGLNLGNTAWVVRALPREKLAAIGDFITVRSYRFSADIVSVAGNGRSFKRCRIVIDAQSSPPKVMYRQDLTHLGWPLAPEILAALRAGTPVEQLAPNRSLLETGGLP